MKLVFIAGEHVAELLDIECSSPTLRSQIINRFNVGRERTAGGWCLEGPSPLIDSALCHLSGPQLLDVAGTQGQKKKKKHSQKTGSIQQTRSHIARSVQSALQELCG